MRSREAEGCVVVGIAGGSASGKTTVVAETVARIGADRAAVLPHDAYYHDLSHLSMEERRRTNVDHPDSLETGLYVEHLTDLRSGRPVEMPLYDFATHTRSSAVRVIEPAPLLIAEGLLLLHDPRLRELLDVKVYVSVDEEERLARRLRRDVRDRGRTPASVRADHRRRVEPMHRRFVRPSREHADVVIRGGAHNSTAIDDLVRRLERLLAGGSATL